MCGQRKDVSKCFCPTCYFGLTPPLRNGLYTRLDAGDGEFEERYLEAMRHLKAKGHARKMSEWTLEARKIVMETGLIEVLRERKNAIKQ